MPDRHGERIDAIQTLVTIRPDMLSTRPGHLSQCRNRESMTIHDGQVIERRCIQIFPVMPRFDPPRCQNVENAVVEHGAAIDGSNPSQSGRRSPRDHARSGFGISRRVKGYAGKEGDVCQRAAGEDENFDPAVPQNCEASGLLSSHMVSDL